MMALAVRRPPSAAPDPALFCTWGAAPLLRFGVQYVTRWQLNAMGQKWYTSVLRRGSALTLLNLLRTHQQYNFCTCEPLHRVPNWHSYGTGCEL